VRYGWTAEVKKSANKQSTLPRNVEMHQSTHVQLCMVWQITISVLTDARLQTSDQHCKEPTTEFLQRLKYNAILFLLYFSFVSIVRTLLVKNATTSSSN